MLTDENFEKEINAGDKFILVDFFAVWCEPCSMLAPVLEKIAEEFKNKIIFECQMSFHRKEQGNMEHQPIMPDVG